MKLRVTDIDTKRLEHAKLSTVRHSTSVELRRRLGIDCISKVMKPGRLHCFLHVERKV